MFQPTSGRAKTCSRVCYAKHVAPRNAEAQRDYYARELAKDPLFLRRMRLRNMYRVTLEWVEERLAEQGGCAVCHTWEPGGRGWHVDHDHRCCQGMRSCGDCVRGVLCPGCNVGIGSLGDDPERLRSAARYLEAAHAVARGN